MYNGAELDYFKWSAKVAQSTCNISFLLMGFSGIFLRVLLAALPWSVCSTFLHRIFLFSSLLDALEKKAREAIIMKLYQQLPMKMKSSRVSADYSIIIMNLIAIYKLQMLFLLHGS